jgi:hypothetical protein
MRFLTPTGTAYIPRFDDILEHRADEESRLAGLSFPSFLELLNAHLVYSGVSARFDPETGWKSIRLQSWRGREEFVTDESEPWGAFFLRVAEELELLVPEGG